MMFNKIILFYIYKMGLFSIFEADHNKKKGALKCAQRRNKHKFS